MKRAIQIIIGSLVGITLIWFLFRNTDWHLVFHTIRDVDWRWIIVGQVFAWVSYFTRVQRWSYVVRAGHSASFRSMLSATQIGFLVNFTIPARIGEAVRAYILTRLTKTPLSQSLAMVALDRVNDVIALLAVLFLALLFFPISGAVEIAAGLIGNTEPIVISSRIIKVASISCSALLAVAMLFFIFLYLKQELVLKFLHICVAPVSQKLDDVLQKAFCNFTAGLHIFRSGRDMAKSTFFSMLTWAVNIFFLASMLLAFGLHLPWATSLVMMAMLSVFITVPVAPGMIGQYHLPIIICILAVAPQTNLDLARAVAILTHAMSLIPIALLGVYCLFREGIGLHFLLRVKTDKQSVNVEMPNATND